MIHKLSRNQFSALDTNEFINNVMENYDSLVKIKKLANNIDLKNTEITDLIKFVNSVKEITG